MLRAANILKLLKKHVLFFCFLAFIGCSDKKDAFLTIPEPEEAASTETYIIAASGDTNTRSVSAYSLTGEFVSIIKHFLVDVATVRGISVLGPSELMISLDATDKIQYLTWDPTNGADNEQLVSVLTGNVYDIESDTSGNSFVLVSNAVRRFDADGLQVGNPYIGATVGSCVLNNPRSMHLTSSNHLIVTNQGGTDNILVYDVTSPTTPTCLTSTAVGNNPWGALLHSDGNMYFVTQGDDQIWKANSDASGATAIFTTDLAYFNNPTAILELPNGNLAIASSGTDVVWEMDTSGTIVGTQPLIQHPTSLNIVDLELLDVSN